MLERWGRLVHRFRGLVLACSVVLLALSAVVAARGGDLQNPDTLASSESGRASRLLNSDLPRASGTPVGTSFLILFESDTLSVTDEAFKRAVLDAIAPLRTDPRVQILRTYYDAPAQSGALLSRDGKRTAVSVTLRDFRSVADHYYDDLRAEVRSDTLRVLPTGSLPINHDVNRILDDDLHRAELVSLPIALVLLVIVFGTIVGALIPLAVGVLAIVGGLAGVFTLTRWTDVSPYAVNIVTLVGLGTAIDYSLFIVARFREELAAGRATEDAVGRAMATSGRAVLFSGLTVAIGLAGLLFFDGTFLASIGLAGTIVVAIAVLYAWTFLPALLSVLGPRVNALRVPLAGASTSGMWHRLAMGVMARPLLVLVPTVAIILAAGSPFLAIRLANADATVLPPQAESRRGYDSLVANFPGQEQSTVNVIAHWATTDPRSPAATDYVSLLTSAYSRLLNVIRVNPPIYGQHIAWLAVVSSKPAASDEARELVREIRGESAIPLMPGAPAPDGELLVSGATAFDLDTIDFIETHAIRAVAFIIGLTLIALWVLLGSVVLPVKAVVMNLLSITASFGALVWVFVEGHLATQLNFTPQSLDPAVPVILFCIVFGLSMDYEVFLLSRIQEEYRRGGDNTHAVAEGLERSARLITAAALIMVAVFVGFALADIVIIKSIGIGMAVAVALDATLVRALIVPATMRLLGRWNWWSPRPLARLHRRLVREPGKETAA